MGFFFIRAISSHLSSHLKINDPVRPPIFIFFYCAEDLHRINVIKYIYDSRYANQFMSWLENNILKLSCYVADVACCIQAFFKLNPSLFQKLMVYFAFSNFLVFLRSHLSHQTMADAAPSAAKAVDSSYGFLTTRKPKLSKALLGGKLKRCEPRQWLELPYQQPPRSKRSEPVLGPVGFVTLPAA